MTDQTEQKIWDFFRAITKGFLRWRFAYSYQEVDLGTGPCIVLANHTTDYDPLLIGAAFQKHLTFVASEHVFRKGIASRVLNGLFHPISRMKGTTDATAGMAILRALRNGKSICMFAEGNRSFNGVTGPVFPATGKLCRISGAELITYRIEGGYLTSPRWAKTLRRGKMTGHVVERYSAETLQSISAQEVNDRINRDLYEDAFSRQIPDPIPFSGRRLAEGIERAFYLCPRCREIGGIRSKGNRFFCGCGMSAEYTEYGFLDGEGFPFRTVLEWDKWQTEQMQKLVLSIGENETAFEDPEVKLQKLSEAHTTEQVDHGLASMGKERLQIGKTVIPIRNVSSMAVVGPSKVVFCNEGQYYEIGNTKGNSFCGRKYLEFYEQLSEQRKG